jgi:V/A-type H+/Na+-transporting ATPase subunit I
MIDKMHKLLFYGAKDAVKEFMVQAQKIGSCQFFSVRKKVKEALPKEVQKVLSVLKILQKQPVIKQEHLGVRSCSHLAKKILHHQHELQGYFEELKKIRVECIKVAPFGNFDLDTVAQIKKDSGKIIQFFMIRHAKISTLEDIPQELIFIKREKDFDYFISIGDTLLSHKTFYEVHIERTSSDLNQRELEVQDLIQKGQNEIAQAAQYLKAFKEYLVQQFNQTHLESALDDIEFYLNDELFCIDAWIPGSKLASLKQIASQNHVSFSFLKIEKSDSPPTYMKNKGFAKTGEDLVAIYDTPSLADRDPSKWVISFFCIFFAMIVSDAGYGLIFLLSSLFMLYKFKNRASQAAIRAMKLFRTISIVSILWGILVGSYFSIPLAPDSKFNRFNVLKILALKKVQYHVDKQDIVYKEWVKEYPTIVDVFDADSIINKATKMNGGVKKYVILEEIYNSLLLEIALLLGLVHLSISFLRNLFRNYSGIGWFIALWGGFFAFSTVVDAVTIFSYVGSMSVSFAKSFGFDLLYGGLIVALLLSIIQEGLIGIAALFKTIEIFADVLSYLRLYALGLASMVMAATFNEIAMMTGSYFFGALICLFGHTINMGLAIMAGVIHGLRLNFLEWYRHSFEGGGCRFNPLRILTNPSCE